MGQPKAIIKKVCKGKKEGEYRFVLKGGNGEIVATSHTETYKSKQMCIKTLQNLFPNFQIVDTTATT